MSPPPENKSVDKRARIVAAEQARAEAERAAGRQPTPPAPRSNWAASESKAPPRRFRKPPPR